MVLKMEFDEATMYLGDFVQSKCDRPKYAKECAIRSAKMIFFNLLTLSWKTFGKM